MRFSKILFLMFVTLHLASTERGFGQLKVWDGPALGDWTDVFSWSPNGTPGPGDTVRIGFVPGTEYSRIRFETFESINNLEIGFGSEVNIMAPGALLDVADTVTVGGMHDGHRSELLVQPSAGTHFQTAIMTIEADGVLTNLNFGHLNFTDRLVVEPFGEVHSRGTFHFFDDTGVAFNQSGLLDTRTGGLTLNQLGDALFDLDGTFGDGVLRIDGGNGFFGQDHLTVNGTELTDPFSGTIELATASILDMNLANGWIADGNSEISVYGSNSNSDGNTRILGSDWWFGGTMTLIDGISNTGHPVEIYPATTISDTAVFHLEQNNFLDFYGPTVFEGGEFFMVSSQLSDGHVRLLGPTQWRGQVTVLGAMSQNSDATVSEATIIDAELFNMDGDGPIQWDVGHRLSVNTAALDINNNSFNGTLNIGGGIFTTVEIQLDEPGESWEMAGQMELSNFLPLPSTKLSGSPVEFTGFVGVNDIGIRISADTHFTDQAIVEFDNPSASLVLNGHSRLDENLTLSGSGELFNGSPGHMVLADNFDLAPVSLVNQGLLEVEDGPGFATAPDFSMAASGSVLFELGGYSAGPEFDRLNVADSSAIIDGRIMVKLIDIGGGPFQPAINDTFVVLTAPSGVIGQFTNSPVSVVAGNGYVWEVIHNPFDVTLRLDAIVPDVTLGDLNQDGMVDLLDVSLFVTALNDTNYEIRADINCDGIVDLLDVQPFVELLTGQ